MNISKAAYLFNPFSGSGTTVSHLKQLQQYAEGLFSITPVSTTKDGFKTEITDLCSKNYSCIIVAGGDGTIHAVVEGIMKTQASTCIAILPLGTGNDLAKALGVFQRFKKTPLSYLQSLVQSIHTKKTTSCRVLLFNKNIYFINYAGVGVDAAILQYFEKWRGIPIPNRLIYFFAALSNIFTFPNMKLSLSFTERGVRKVRTFSSFKQALILNISSYGGGFIQVPDICIQEGSFRLIVINKLLSGILVLVLRNKFPAFVRFFSKKMRPEEFTVSEIIMHFSHSQNMQIDGEFLDGVEGNKKITINAGGIIQIIQA